MMCAFGAAAAEAYACYTSSNTTLTFYYDNQRSSRTGTTYDLNTVDDYPSWLPIYPVKYVVFDPSFAAARPTSTSYWFIMSELESITGLSYLNTSEVVNMEFMFSDCNLTSLDLSSFNTSQVTNMKFMFYECKEWTSLDLSSFNTAKVKQMDYMFKDNSNLQTIYVGDGWSTAAGTYSSEMFWNCTNLVGGQGTTYDANHVDKTYAHIDGGPSNPGYFTEKNAALRGDVNGDREVNIADVNAVIDIILGGNDDNTAADVNGDGEINIADVNAVIDIILGGA